jgi:xanthine dehydrogenase accessory factor
VSDRVILEALLAAKQAGKTAVLATIIRDKGSVPRHSGSKMLVYPDGRIVGTIGGGEMESRVIAALPDLLEGGIPAILHYDLADPARGDPGVCGGQVDIFMEPILPEPTVLVIGCGHVGQAVVELAHWLGLHVIACDDRADLCNPQATPYADEYLIVPPAEIANKVPIHQRTYIAATTRGAPLDVKILPTLIKTPAPYIGVIGSRRRWATAVRKLAEQGISEKDLERIHAPIGLELNAETPREIALSIMGEIIAAQRGGTGKTMKWMGTPEQAEAASEADH